MFKNFVLFSRSDRADVYERDLSSFKSFKVNTKMTYKKCVFDVRTKAIKFFNVFDCAGNVVRILWMGQSFRKQYLLISIERLERRRQIKNIPVQMHFDQCLFVRVKYKNLNLADGYFCRGHKNGRLGRKRNIKLFFRYHFPET